MTINISASWSQNEEEHRAVTLASTLEILGPFQIGTREATWGADPLEVVGGFRSLSYDEDRVFRSSLSQGGLTQWNTQAWEEVTSTQSTTEARACVGFENVNWDSLLAIYGWAALQYQAWARTEIDVSTDVDQTIAVFTDGILEFWIDDELFFGGDFYTYRRAPLLVRLSPGSHRFDLRLIRDVRAMGGVGIPTVDFSIRLEMLAETLHLVSEAIILPEAIRGHGLASDLASIPLRNAATKAIVVEDVKSLEDSYDISLLTSKEFVVLPGQCRPLAFRLLQRYPGTSSLDVEISFRCSVSQVQYRKTFHVDITSRDLHEPHRFTFLHPSGIVSYAILRAPNPVNDSGKSGDVSWPVLLNLHGAGLDADNDLVRHMLDPISHISAWTIFPTGVTSWSGDDWHVWGLADIEAAINALPKWLKDMSWKPGDVNRKRIYIVGHSNGGQGTWHLLTRQPDRIVAAAPVSGYSSIQAYVPYQFWREAEPHISLVLQATLASYRHELLTENFAAIPIYQQHGQEDENVPVFHSRRLGQLLVESGGSSQYLELAKKRHWFDGIMTTQFLRSFYESIESSRSPSSDLPKKVRALFPNSADMGSCNGIFVDQLISPDHFGVVEVERHISASTWILSTSNVFRFHLDKQFYDRGFPSKIVVDGVELAASLPYETWYVKGSTDNWQICRDQDWKSINQRFGSQVGTMDAFLRTQGIFLISYMSAGSLALALQVARNLYQYFGADSEIAEGHVDSSWRGGNIVRILRGAEGIKLQESSLLRFNATGLSITDSNDNEHRYPYQEGLGAIHLSPRQAGGLQLNIWGHDQQGLQQAARLLPMLTGVGQPDFVILSKRCAWEGAAGILGAGFLDRNWKVSQASFLR